MSEDGPRCEERLRANALGVNLPRSLTIITVYLPLSDVFGVAV